MIRGTFANIRLRNQLLDDVSGGYTVTSPSRAARYVHLTPRGIHAAQNIPLVVLGGKEHGPGRRGTGPRRTSLLGVRAVITEVAERIHRPT